MTDKMEHQYTMKLALREFLLKNVSITAGIPNYTPLFTTFSSNLNQIQQMKEQLKADISGVAAFKKQLRNDLIGKVSDIGKKIEAYADLTNDIILKKEVHISDSKLKKASGSVLKDYALLIFNKATTNLTALTTYGVSAASLEALEEAIDSFSAAMPKPRLSIVDRKKLNAQVKTLFKANQELLKKFDSGVEVVSLTHPDFYASYHDLRKVIETGKRSLAVKGVITSTDGTPVRGASVSFRPENPAAKAMAEPVTPVMVKKTAKKGGFNIKDLPAGMYAVTVSKVGFADQVLVIAVSNSETSKIKVELVRV